MKSLRRIRGDRTGIEQLVKWVGVVGLVVSLGLLYVWQQIQTRDLKLDILQLEERKDRLVKENSSLQVHVLHLSDQETIEPQAKTLFSLNHPAVGQIVAMNTGNPSPSVAFNPVNEKPSSGKATTAVLPLASVSISHLSSGD